MIDRTWDVADLMKNESAFSAKKQQFRTLVQLPNFRDLQMGLAGKINERVDDDYVGLFSNDGFHSRDSRFSARIGVQRQGILTENKFFAQVGFSFPGRFHR